MAPRRFLNRVFPLAAALALLAAPAFTAPGRSRRHLQPAPSIDPAAFVDVVDNEFFPLTPGTTLYYEGEAEGVASSNEVAVTRRKKVILGVACIEVHDRAFEEGELVEDTLDWFAQDVDGNVWYFGEDSKEIEDGEVVSTEGSWMAGVNGALPGIIMEADPKVGDRYAQEDAPGVAEDLAKVVALDGSACVALGCFDGLLVTKEWTPLERGVVENKYYAEGIGEILSVMVKGGDERSELVRITAPGQ